jgi:hypothetical protein
MKDSRDVCICWLKEYGVRAMADGRLKDKNGRLDGRFKKDNLPCQSPMYIGVLGDYGRLLGWF